MKLAELKSLFDKELSCSGFRRLFKSQTQQQYHKYLDLQKSICTDEYWRNKLNDLSQDVGKHEFQTQITVHDGMLRHTKTPYFRFANKDALALILKQAKSQFDSDITKSVKKLERVRSAIIGILADQARLVTSFVKVVLALRGEITKAFDIGFSEDDFIRLEASSSNEQASSQYKIYYIRNNEDLVSESYRVTLPNGESMSATYTPSFKGDPDPDVSIRSFNSSKHDNKYEVVYEGTDSLMKDGHGTLSVRQR